MKKKGFVSNLIWLLAIVAVCAIGLAIFVPNYLAARSRGSNETGCKSNLKNIGTAMEMYSTDWYGKYPTSLSQLTPNYLKTLPECPLTYEMTYRAAFGPGVGYNKGMELEDGTRMEPFTDYYLIWCEGTVHKERYETPENFPQYDGIQGLIER
jgi:competence protein ComGC